MTARTLAPRLVLGLALGLALGVAACAQTPAGNDAARTDMPAPPATASSPDYADSANWLCLPGRANDACTQDQTTTIVAADGSLTPEPFRAAADAPIDCFYVYPTVSTDTTPNSDMSIDAAERFVVQQQFARFASVCRTFAPMYRQVTVAALRAMLLGRPFTADRAMAYGDVKAAWDHYIQHHNSGRGVILIGHSQGAGVITELVANEIEGKPVANRLIAAYVIGANLPVPRGALVGGAFKSTPLCASKMQTGCAVSYVSFRTTAPPPASSRFGTTQMNSGLTVSGDMAAACVNPAALLRPQSGPVGLSTYLAAGGRASSIDSGPQPAWAKGKTVTTPFVSVPGLLSAQCVSTPTHTYLSITTNADAADPRIDAIPGDILVFGRPLADWGLHLIDVNLAMGDLVELARHQSEAYRARR